MIDTLKLYVPIEPREFAIAAKQGLKTNAVESKISYFKIAINNDKKSIDYSPSLTFYKRIINESSTYNLSLEFSAPKLLFGNNILEVTDEDLTLVVEKLTAKVYELSGCLLSPERLATASVTAAHYSKNFIFDEPYITGIALKKLLKLSVSMRLDVARNQYRIGESLQFHNKSVDIIFYDKSAESKSHNSYIPENLSGKGILRFEVRISGSRKLKSLIQESNSLEQVFKSKHSSDVLNKYWNEFYDKRFHNGENQSEAIDIFENYLLKNSSASAPQALQATAILRLINESDTRYIQNLITTKFGSRKWYRLKKLLPVQKAPGPLLLESISEDLQKFVAIRPPP